MPSKQKRELTTLPVLRYGFGHKKRRFKFPILYVGDYMSHYPSGGISTTDEKIKNNPSEALSFIRASQHGIQYYAQNRAESIKLVTSYLGIKGPHLRRRFMTCIPAG